MDNELLGGVGIASVHADLDDWAELDVGFDESGNLVFEMTYDRINDHGNTKNGWSKRITVDRIGMEVIMRKMRVGMTELPEAFYEIFGSEGELWNVSGVFDRFNEIQNYLSCLRLRYKFEKTIKR